MSIELMPLTDRSLIRRAEEALTEHILSGAVAPGDLLPPEQALGRQLGIGRSTIREAISILEAKGLVERQRGVGVRVIDRSQEAASAMLELMFKRQGAPALDLLELRKLYEIQAAAWAAERATEEDLRLLRRALEAMWREDATLDQCVEADLDFHAAIARATHNPVLVWLVATLRSLLQDAIRITMQEGVRPEGVYRNHLPILEAIVRRDGPGAAQAMATHLGFIEARLRQTDLGNGNRAAAGR